MTAAAVEQLMRLSSPGYLACLLQMRYSLHQEEQPDGGITQQRLVRLFRKAAAAQQTVVGISQSPLDNGVKQMC